MERARTPWTTAQGSEIRNAEGDFIAETSFQVVYGKGKVTKQNIKTAAIIVKAVNSHDDLVAACKYAIELINAEYCSHSYGKKTCGYCEKLEQVLQKAEA